MELLPATPEDIAIFKQAVAARYLQRGVPAKMASALFNRHMLKVAADLGIKTSNVMSAPVAGPMPMKSPATTPIPPPKPAAQVASTATPGMVPPGGKGPNVTGAAAMGGAGMMTSMAASGLKKIAIASGLRKFGQFESLSSKDISQRSADSGGALGRIPGIVPRPPNKPTIGQRFKGAVRGAVQGGLAGARAGGDTPMPSFKLPPPPKHTTPPWQRPWSPLPLPQGKIQ
jgi:hypothetical protein